MKNPKTWIRIYCAILFVMPLLGCQQATTTVTTTAFPTTTVQKNIGAVEWTFPNYWFEQKEKPKTRLGREWTSLKIAFVDPDRAVESVKLVFQEVDTLYDCQMTEYVIGEYRDEAGRAKLSYLFITGLTTGVEYRVILLASGHDGVAAFTDREIGSQEFTTDSYEGVVDSTHGMAAYIQDGGIVHEGYSVQIHFSYDEEYALATTQAVDSFVTRIRDEDGTVLHEEALAESGTIPIFFENAVLGFDYVISVENTAGDIVLCRHSIRYEQPAFGISVNETAEGRTITFSWSGNACMITGGYIEILDNDSTYRLYTIEEGMSRGEIVLAVPEELAALDQFRFHVRFTYSAFDGYATDSVNFVVMQWQ